MDMMSDWDFPDGDRLVRAALRVAPAIAALAERCRRGGVPVIYANDNHGQWRSDFRFVVRQALGFPGPGGRIARLLAPHDEDYVVLKPKHSAFFATPLELLLDHLRARRIIVVGTTTDQCVLATAMDARMRDFEVVVPEDGVATLGAARNRRALVHLREVLGLTTPPAARLNIGKP